jgi:hypothetical protein
MSVSNARITIENKVLTWEGVTSHPHQFGGTEYRLGKRELGHIHGNALVDIPFPKKVRDAVIAEGKAEPHHILPDSGWISLFLNHPQDVETAIELLQRSYELAVAQQARRSPPTDGADSAEEAHTEL